MRDRGRERGDLARTSGSRDPLIADESIHDRLGNRRHLARLRAAAAPPGARSERGAEAAAASKHVSPEAAHARIHAGPESAAAAAAIGARAFTIGDDVFIGHDAPDDVLLHELEHVAQHRRGESDAAVHCNWVPPGEGAPAPRGPTSSGGEGFAYLEGGFPRFLQMQAETSLVTYPMLDAIFSPEELTIYRLTVKAFPEEARELLDRYKYPMGRDLTAVDARARALVRNVSRLLDEPEAPTVTITASPEQLEKGYLEYLQLTAMNSPLAQTIHAERVPIYRAMAMNDPDLGERLIAFQEAARYHDRFVVQRMYQEGTFTRAEHEAYMTAMLFQRTGAALRSPFGAMFYGLASLRSDDPMWLMQSAELGATFGAPLEAMGHMPGASTSAPRPGVEMQWGAPVRGTSPGKEIGLGAPGSLEPVNNTMFPGVRNYALSPGSKRLPALELAAPSSTLKAPNDAHLAYGMIDPNRPQSSALQGMDVGTLGRSGMDFHTYTAVEAGFGYRVNFDPVRRLPRWVEFDLIAQTRFIRAPDRPSRNRLDAMVPRDQQGRPGDYKGQPFEQAHGMNRAAAASDPAAVRNLDQTTNMFPAAGRGSTGVNQGPWKAAEAEAARNAATYGYIRVRITPVGPYRKVGKLEVPSAYQIEHFNPDGNSVYGVTLLNR